MTCIWKMQIVAFSELLDKYQDYDMSPGAESLEKIIARYEQPWTVYYFIVVENENVGVIRVVTRKTVAENGYLQSGLCRSIETKDMPKQP